MSWYKTKNWEYVSHTKYEMVLQSIANPQLTAIIYKDEKLKPSLYLGLLYSNNKAFLKLLEYDADLINKMKKQIYFKKGE